MKKILSAIVAMICCLPLVVSAADKVKVYVFFAGGCGACEAQFEYLEGLEGYNKTFEVVKKELYEQVGEWNQGADYDLGVKVANAFYEAGYTDATYEATPFVVISDSYAASIYNSELEKVINEVAKTGDKDIVGCMEEGRSDCNIPVIAQTGNTGNTNGSTTSTSLGSSNMVIVMTAIISTIIIVAVYLVKSTMDKTQVLEALNNKKK